MIEIMETFENADGSLTLNLEMSQEVINNLLEYAINDIFRKQLKEDFTPKEEE